MEAALSTEPPNIARFNRIALTLFETLYESFPVPLDMNPRTTGADAAEAAEAASPDAAASDDEEAAFDAAAEYVEEAGHVVRWLRDEGFMRINSEALSGDFYGVVLTSKALAVLRYTPTAIGDRPAAPEPIIAKVKRALAAGAEKAGKDAASEAMGLVITAALRAGSSLWQDWRG